MPDVAGDVAHHQPGEIDQAEMLLGELAFEGHRLAPVAVIHPPGSFAVDMDHFRLSDISERQALVDQPARPGQVFQASQSFIIGMPFPQAAPDGGIGVITERLGLAWAGLVREPVGEDLLLEKLLSVFPRCLP